MQARVLVRIAQLGAMLCQAMPRALNVPAALLPQKAAQCAHSARVDGFPMQARALVRLVRQDAMLRQVMPCVANVPAALSPQRAAQCA